MKDSKTKESENRNKNRNKNKMGILIATAVILLLVIVSAGSLVNWNQKKPQRIGISTNATKNAKIVKIYYFYSEECPACKAAKPYAQNISKSVKNMVWCSVENRSNECVSTAAKYDVEFIPTAIVLYDNGSVRKFVGTDEIKRLSDSLLK